MRFSDWLLRLRHLRSGRVRRRNNLRSNQGDLGIQIDSLEDRILLAATTTITLDGSGNIVVTDTNGGNTNDRFNLSTNAAGTFFNVSDNSNILETSIPGATGSGTTFVSIPLAGISGVIINAEGGNDTFTVHNISAQNSLNLTINGGAGSDSTTVVGTVSMAGGDIAVNTEEIVFTFDSRISNTDAINLNAVASDTKTLNAPGSLFPLAIAQINLASGSQVTANSLSATAQATTTATVTTSSASVDARARATVLFRGTVTVAGAVSMVSEVDNVVNVTANSLAHSLNLLTDSQSTARVTEGGRVTAGTLSIVAHNDTDIKIGASNTLEGSTVINSTNITLAGVIGNAIVAVGAGPISGTQPSSLLIQAIDDSTADVDVNVLALTGPFSFSVVTSELNLNRSTQAFIGDNNSLTRESVTSGGSVKIDAQNRGMFTGDINSDFVGFVANNVIDATSAIIDYSTVAAKAIEIGATNSATFSATGKIAQNKASGSTKAFIDHSTINATPSVVTDGVRINARDGVSINAASTDVVVDLDTFTNFSPLSIDAAAARNQYIRDVDAFIANSAVNVTSGIVSASATNAGLVSSRVETSAVKATNLLPNTFSLSLAGGLSVNEVRGGVNAYIRKSNVTTTTAGDISLTAVNSTGIDATSGLSSNVELGPLNSGTIGVAGGASVAFNAFGLGGLSFFTAPITVLLGSSIAAEDPALTQSYILDSTINSAGDVNLTATGDARLNSTVSNAVQSTASSLFGASGISASGILSRNLVSTKTQAYIGTSMPLGSPVITNAVGTVNINATDDAFIHANSKVVSSSIITNDGGASVLNEAIALLTPADFSSDDGTKSVSFGKTVRLSDTYANGGTPSLVYEYLGTTQSLDLGTEDYSDLGYWKEKLATTLIPQGNNISPSSSVALGGLVASNDVRSDVDAYINASTVVVGGVSINALARPSIEAMADSTAKSVGGSAYGQGTALAINGTLATSQVLSASDAYITNSNVTTSVGNVNVDAETDATINSTIQTSTSSSDTAVGLTLAFNTIGYLTENVLVNTLNGLLGSNIGVTVHGPVRKN